MTCSDPSGGKLCSRPDNTCGYDCNWVTCGSHFGQCIDPQLGGLYQNRARCDAIDWHQGMAVSTQATGASEAPVARFTLPARP